MKNRSNMLLLGVLFASGCTTIPDHFPELSDSVESLSGYRISKTSTEDTGDLNALISELSTRPLILKSAVQIALLNNPLLQATYQDLDIAVAELIRAKRPMNPELSMGFIFPDDGNEFEISIVQNFMNLLTIPIRSKIAEAELESVKLDITGQVLDVIAQARVAYYEYLAGRESIAMLHQVVQ